MKLLNVLILLVVKKLVDNWLTLFITSEILLRNSKKRLFFNPYYSLFYIVMVFNTMLRNMLTFLAVLYGIFALI